MRKKEKEKKRQGKKKREIKRKIYRKKKKREKDKAWAFTAQDIKERFIALTIKSKRKENKLLNLIKKSYERF